ncbi:ANTAR domain-containing protein [Humibacillus xanthopallidus]|uniref:ANTAR domain-containing protein n=1 Tax=Humibacillus xanthopallidus TaxID=412689 RepID=UPI00163A6FCA|nr:ANTAR domain-containing protein [Humibacillus xanthopallidus]
MTTTHHPSPDHAHQSQSAAAPWPAAGGQTEIEALILEMLQQLDDAGTKVGHLERALDHSRDIGAAVGVLMAGHKLKQADAFELLRETSQEQNRKLYDLALAVIDTGELPTRD